MFLSIVYLTILATVCENSFDPEESSEIFEGIIQKNGLYSSIKWLLGQCSIAQFHVEHSFKMRSGSKDMCCKKLVALECLLTSSTDNNLPLDKLLDSSDCGHYISEPSLCGLHISDQNRVQLQSLTCKNEAKYHLQANSKECCIQLYHSQCFKLNFLEECKKSMTSQGIDCDRFISIDAQCGSLHLCPSYSPKKICSGLNFFTSRFFLFSLLSIIILFGFCYTLLLRSQKSDKISENIYDIPTRLTVKQ